MPAGSDSPPSLQGVKHAAAGYGCSLFNSESLRRQGLTSRAKATCHVQLSQSPWPVLTCNPAVQCPCHGLFSPYGV